MIPNTTPTPNLLFNGEMKKMSDPELRVVMIVTRATFGWILDDKSGMRKEEDWISHSQMIERSGKSSRAISYAIASCIKNRWIEARDDQGNILATANERRLYGKKIFYRLGIKFLGRAETIANGANPQPSHVVQTTIANDDIKPSHQVRTTKESITKETIQKNTHGEFENVFLKEEEYQKLVERITENNAKILIEELSAGIASKGYKYKSHYATLLNWARRRALEHQSKLQTKKKEFII